MKKLVIIDINNFIYRAYFGIQQRLTAPDGTPVNAVFGTFNMIHRLIKDQKPTAVIVAKDSRESKRKELYPEYKQNRSKMPEDLIKQIKLIHEMLGLMNFFIMESPGYEADDIIHSVVNKYHESYDKILIASSDKDLMQLVDDKVNCIDTMKDKVYGTGEVSVKLGVNPNQVVDFLALLGDSSDNIPGVKGIGEKTAVKLLKEYGSLDGLYLNIQKLPDGKAKSNLIEHEAMARLSYSLAQLKTVTTVDEIPEFCNEFKPELKDFLLKLNMKSAITKLSGDN
jgi:DNA polymerase-1